MSPSFGYTPLDVNPKRDTICDVVRDTMVAFADASDKNEVCPVCAQAALVHCAISLLRQQGVPTHMIDSIVVNALDYAEEQMASADAQAADETVEA